MEQRQRVRISKFLSRHLRHAPEDIGLELEAGGWVTVVDLLAACQKNGVRISRADLDLIVATSDKKRFAFDEGGTRIRANQGHSVDVDLQLEQLEPPEELYHGTGHGNVESILRTGLCKMKRHHVHLPRDIVAAVTVGRRHGRPVVFRVAAAAMHRAGFAFFCSANGVWLVDAVPAEYLEELDIP